MITLDLDNEEHIMQKLHNVKLFFSGVENLRIVYRSSSHAGHYHIKIYGVKNNYDVREILGDDKKRIILDKNRELQGLPINVLFTIKRYPNGEIKFSGPWKEYNGAL